MAVYDLKGLRENSGGTFDEILLNDVFHVSHGIEACGVRTFDNSSHILTLASVTYWWKGVRYTTASPVTCDIDEFETLTARKLYYFYFDAPLGVLKCADTVWDWYEHTFVCTVFWNGSAGAVQKEIHSYRRNIPLHMWAHDTIGTRYESGFGLTLPTTTTDGSLQIETGTFHDEDMEVVTGQCTTMRGWYQYSSGIYTFGDYALPYIGTAGQPQYLDIDTWALANVSANDFVCMWVYAGNDDARPCYMVPTQASAAHLTIALARAEVPPALSGLNFNADLKLCYRFIYKGDGNFQESSDYRLSSPVPGGGLTQLSAGSVTYTPSGNISSTSVQTAIEELDAEKLAVASKASSAEIVTGTEDTKYVTSKGLKDAEMIPIHVGTSAPSDTTILWLDTN